MFLIICFPGNTGHKCSSKTWINQILMSAFSKGPYEHLLTLIEYPSSCHVTISKKKMENILILNFSHGNTSLLTPSYVFDWFPIYLSSQQQVKIHNPFSDVVLLHDLSSITILKSSEILWMLDCDPQLRWTQEVFLFLNQDL